ncbi:MAG: vWA domain-containing protein, partial [Candidatus Kapaibacteriota bacterium]
MKTSLLRKPLPVLLSSLLFAIVCSGSLFLSACGSSRTREFALSAESASDSTEKRPIYITGKKNIDQADPDALILDVWKVESEDYPKEVRVFARVLDSSGNFISGMADPYYKGTGSYKRYWSGITQILGGDTVKVKDYVVREYGDQDSITYALALTLDHGGSMAGAVQYLLEAARMFVKMKYPNDRIAVAKFDKKITVERKLTADLRQLDSALRNNDLKGYGLYTALYDAMKESVDLLKNTNPNTPRALVVFTDGEDNASKTTDAELYAYARANNVRIFPVGFGYVNDSTLTALAQYTGGKFYKVRSKQEFQSAFKDIYESLRNFYKITYSPTPFAGKTNVKIALRTRGDGDLGFDENGFDKDGFDINGFDRDGFDRDGFDPNGLDKQGRNRKGFDKNGNHKNGSAFDDMGFDNNGFDKNGFNKDGFDKSGFNKSGKDKNGKDKNAANTSGFDKNGFDKNGF